MKLLRTSIAVAALLSAVGAPEDAHAIDFKIKGEPLRLDLTESMFLSAHLDDGTADPTTKNYGELVNRLNAQLAWRQWLLAVRFDSGAWVHTPGPGTRSPYHDDAQHTCQPGAAALPGKTPMQSEQSCAIQAPNDGPTPDGSSLDRLRSAPGDEAIRNNPADNLRFRYHSHVVRRRIFGQ